VSRRFLRLLRTAAVIAAAAPAAAAAPRIAPAARFPREVRLVEAVFRGAVSSLVFEDAGCERVLAAVFPDGDCDLLLAGALRAFRGVLAEDCFAVLLFVDGLFLPPELRFFDELFAAVVRLLELAAAFFEGAFLDLVADDFSAVDRFFEAPPLLRFFAATFLRAGAFFEEGFFEEDFFAPPALRAVPRFLLLDLAAICSTSMNHVWRRQDTRSVRT